MADKNKKRFVVTIEVIKGEEENVKALVKSVALEIEGDAPIYAGRVREILNSLCSLLGDALSDTQIEEITK